MNGCKHPGNYSHKAMGGRLYQLLIKNWVVPRNDDGNHRKEKTSHIKKYLRLPPSDHATNAPLQETKRKHSEGPLRI